MSRAWFLHMEKNASRRETAHGDMVPPKARGFHLLDTRVSAALAPSLIEELNAFAYFQVILDKQIDFSQNCPSDTATPTFPNDRF